MDIILIQDVPALGKIGEVVKVKDGYARNFLLPHNMAYLATQSNLKRIEVQQKKRQEASEKTKQDAMQVAEKLNKVSCTVNVEVNDLDKLYGAVSEAEVVKALEVEGFEIDKKQVVFDKSIEELGIFDVGVKLHPEVTAKIRLWVTKK
ncbi:MAG TPA: 50S ribosomal protein L9 [Candidatus Omnitrophota bacterium]|nr:50S ribosomal protein L9 [Candidatus Omnitrophota bacterium]